MLFSMERAYAVAIWRYNMGSGRRYFYSPGLNDGTKGFILDVFVSAELAPV